MKRKEFKQGIYRPINPHKYAGKGNPEYRSGWEMKFFIFLDKNPNVLCWASESVVIPYVSPIDQKTHRYFVDCVILLQTPQGPQKYLVEIKPSKQTMPPKQHGNKKQTTILYENAMYQVNQAKWESARKWCEKHGMKFMILTEKEIFNVI